MTEALTRTVDVRSQVNEKLLQALITLLALKDEHLLAELTIIFGHARQMYGEVGSASDEVWTHIDRQLGVIATLTADDEDTDDENMMEAEGQPH